MKEDAVVCRWYYLYPFWYCIAEDGFMPLEQPTDGYMPLGAGYMPLQIDRDGFTPFGDGFMPLRSTVNRWSHLGACARARSRRWFYWTAVYTATWSWAV